MLMQRYLVLVLALVCGVQAVENPRGSNCGNGKDDPCGCPVYPVCPIGKKSSQCDIDNVQWQLRHVAIDYRTTSEVPSGCTSCASASSSSRSTDLAPGDELWSLSIHRIFLSRGSLAGAPSCGPQQYLSTDQQLILVAADASGVGPIWYVDPEHHFFGYRYSETSALVGDTAVDGVLWEQHGRTGSIQLFTSTGTPTADQRLAATAVLRHHDGQVMRFDIINPSGDPASTQRAGRLVRLEDRNGNHVDVAYVHPRDADVGGQLWQRSTLTDMHGLTASFTYGSTPLQGLWPVTRIDLPNGTHVDYVYDSQRLVSVHRPDGTVSTVTVTPDPASSCDIWHIDDPATAEGHRIFDAYLSWGTWADPAHPETVLPQPVGMVRRIRDGAGVVSYRNWDDPQDPFTLYIAEGDRRLIRYRVDALFNAVETAFATDYTADRDPWTCTFVCAQRYDYRMGEPMVRVFDAQGLVTTYDIDPQTMAALGTRYPDGSETTMIRNAFLDPAYTRDALGRVTERTYDARGNVLSETTAVGTPEAATWTATYNARGQRTSFTDAAGRTTDYAYDARGYLTSITEPPDVQGGARAVTTWVTDAAGRRVSMVTPAGQLVVYHYDAGNRVQAVDYADGSQDTVTNGSGSGPAAGQVVSRSDRNGQVTTLTYDAAGRLASTTVAAGTPVAVTTVTTYVPGTMQVASVTTAGDTVVTSVDERLRVVATSRSGRADGPVLTQGTVYDVSGQVIRTTDPYGRRTHQVVDRLGRVVRRIQELIPGAVDLTSVTTALTAAATAAAAADTTFWHATDVGVVALPGTVAVAPGSMIITGSGSDIWGESDACCYAWQSCLADAEVVARVSWVSVSDPWAKAGIMVRSGLGANTVEALVALTPGHGVILQYRSAAGGETEVQDIPVVLNAPSMWLRMRRTGRLVVASTSSDGISWQEAGRLDLPVGVDSRIGMAVCSHDPVALATATFDQVVLQRGGPLTAAAVEEAEAQALLELPRLTSANPAYVIEDQVYDAAGQLLTRTDGDGTVTAWTYDARGRVLTQTEAVGSQSATTSFTYDAVGNRSTVTSPRGVVTATTYTGRNLVSTVTEASGTGEAALVRHLTYTPTRKLASETDALGRVTTYAYGTCCDRLTGITDAAGFTTGFTYDAVGNRLTVTDGNGLTTATAYDARHRPATVTNAAGETSAIAYDDSLIDGVGIDAVPAVAAVLPTLGLGLGADGSAVAMTNAAGETSYDLRDGVGRTVARIDALGHATTVAYNTVVGGLVETAQTDALGHTTSARADGAGRVRVQIDALGHQATATFDAVGNQLTARDANQVGWSAVYDARNRLISRTDTRTTGSGTTTWSYDLDGNRLGETDAIGKTETAVYDLRNRRVQLIDRLQGVTRFAYDAVGNLTQISDADNETQGALANAAGTTQYAYDARNLLIAEAFPTGQQGRTLRVYTYDAGRRLTARNVGILAGAFGPAATLAGTPAPVATVYAYDAANRLTTRGYADGLNDTFAYDPAARLITAASGRYANTVARTYDAAGRLASESLTLPDGSISGSTLAPATWTVGYTYVADNTLASQTYPTGSVVMRTSTDRHELATVSLNDTPVASRTYDAGGRLSATAFGNGLIETRTYVPGDQLVATMATANGSTTVSGFDYIYDTDRRKLSETDLTGSAAQGFAYDDASRLTSWNRSGSAASTQSWNLTKVGDWTSTTRDGVAELRTNTAVHEAVQVGPNILAYDQQGNLTRDEHGSALAWDPENRLICALVTRDASVTGFGSVATYRSDALGRRIAKTVDGVTTLYLPSGAQTVVELTRPALPASQGDIDGSTSDGTLANQALTPASGGILSGTPIRINFQPATTATPAGFLRDTGKTIAVRSNGLTYGWSTDATAQAVVRHGAVPLPEFDTFVQAQPDAGGSASWSIALPDGTYPVIVVAGDALSVNQTNNLVIGGQSVADATPAIDPPAYEQGNFDGYAVNAVVTGGVLTIAPGVGAVHAKLCFVEIGAIGTAVDQVTIDRLAALIIKANAQTGANPEPISTTREYIYGSYVDEVVAYTQKVGDVVAVRYYPHYNHLYSVDALTDSTGAVVEKYSYTAYGKQTITSATGVARAKSAVGFDRGFTGYVADNVTGLLHARARQYSPTLGRFIGRDPKGYVNGYSFYFGYFVAIGVDPSGTVCCKPNSGGPSYQYKGNDGKCPSDAAKVSDSCCDNPPPNLDKCGPDITDLFYGYIKSKVDFLKNRPASETGSIDALVTLSSIGGNIDFWYKGSMDGCATGKCADTVFFCGKCVRSTVMNNILFGFVADALGATFGGATLGADANNWATHGHGEGAEQWGAYAIGYSLWGSSLDSSMSMCDVVNASTWKPSGRHSKPTSSIDSASAAFKVCKPCGKTLETMAGMRVSVGYPEAR